MSKFSTLLIVLILSFSNHLYGQKVNAELFESALEKISSGNWKEGLQEFTSIREQLLREGKEATDNYAFTYISLITSYSSNGQFDKAEKVIKEMDMDILNGLTEWSQMRFALAKGTFYILTKQFKEASVYLNKAYDLNENISLEKNNWSHESVTISLYLSNAYNELGQFEKATPYLSEALSRSKELFGPNHFRVATVYAYVGINLQLQNMVEPALSNFKKFCQINLQEIGSTYLQNQDYQEYDSLTTFYTDVVKLIRKDSIITKIHPADLPNYNNIAQLLMASNKLSLAEQTFKAVRTASKKNGYSFLLIQVQMGLANVYLRLGQPNYALDLYRDALETLLSTNASDKVTASTIYHNMASLHSNMGNLDESFKLNNQALKIRKEIFGNTHFEIANSHLNLGIDLKRLKQYDKSVSSLRKAISSGSNDLDYVYYSLSAAYLEMEQFDSAKRYGLKAISVSKKSEDPFYSDFTTNLGKVYFNQGKLDSAWFYFNEGLESNYNGKITDNKDPSAIVIKDIKNLLDFLEGYSAKANAYLEAYTNSKDLSYLQNANKLYDFCKSLIVEIRSSFVQEVDNLEFSQLTLKVSEKAIESKLYLYEESQDPTYLEQAFWYADLNKSSIVFDAIRTRHVSSSTASEKLIEWADLKNRIRKTETVLRNLKLKSTDEIQIKHHESTLNTFNTILADLLLRIKETQPNLHSYLANQTSNVDVNQLYSYLSDKEQNLIQFFWGTESIFVFTIGQDRSITVNRLNYEQVEGLKEKVDRVTRYVQTPETSELLSFNVFKEDSENLYTSLLQKNMKTREGESFIFIPDGPLSKLPFEVLLTENSSQNKNHRNLPYLLRKYQINYASSASLLLENNKNKQLSNRLDFTAWAPFSKNDSTIMTNSETLRSATLNGLPGATRELQSLSNSLNGNRYYGSLANEANFKKEAPKANIIHIATHGIINNSYPLESNLLFGESLPEDSIEDNRLFIFELYSMNLQSELAVLTACNTGAGKQLQGEGTISLARAFKYAGVKSVLMALWLANDQSTSDIIGNFYQNLAADQGKGEALRNAKLTYLENADNITSHPFYWSHLVLSGNNSPITPTSNSNRLIMFILMGVVVLVVLSRVLRKKYSA